MSGAMPAFNGLTIGTMPSASSASGSQQAGASMLSGRQQEDHPRLSQGFEDRCPWTDDCLYQTVDYRGLAGHYAAYNEEVHDLSMEGRASLSDAVQGDQNSDPVYVQDPWSRSYGPQRRGQSAPGTPRGGREHRESQQAEPMPRQESTQPQQPQRMCATFSQAPWYLKSKLTITSRRTCSGPNLL